MWTHVIKIVQLTFEIDIYDSLGFMSYSVSYGDVKFQILMVSAERSRSDLSESTSLFNIEKIFVYL